MKVKRTFTLLVMVCAFWLIAGNDVGADEVETIHDLDPVIYDKLEFKKNTDYLHDQQKIEMKNTLPVEQFDIDFDGSKQLPDRGNTSYLFQEAEREKKSTVAAMTSEIGLFEDEGKYRKAEEVQAPIANNEQTVGNNTGRTIIFIGLIAVGLLFLFAFLLPRLINQPVPANQKFVK
jgi:hypothetical protein